MASDADHCAVFPLTFINQISVILDKHRTKHYYAHDIIMIRKTRHLSNDIRQRYISSIIPTHSEATSSQIHHFNVYSPAFRDVHSTAGFRWCLWEDAHFGLSQGNDSFFYGQTLIKTQFDSRFEKHRNRRVVYLKLIRQVAHFFKRFRTQFYLKSWEDCCSAKKKRYKSFFP